MGSTRGADVFVRSASWTAGICGLGCGAALEVGGTKSNGSGSTRVTVLDGGRGMPGDAGQSTVSCTEGVPEKSVPSGGVPSHGGGITVESVLVTRVPDESELATWAPAGNVRMLRTRQRGRLCLQKMVKTACWRAGLTGLSVARQGPGCLCNGQWRLVAGVLILGQSKDWALRSAPSAASQRGVVCHSEAAQRHWPGMRGQARECAKGQTKGCERLRGVNGRRVARKGWGLKGGRSRGCCCELFGDGAVKYALDC